MRTVLQSLLQWCVVAEPVVPPGPVDANYSIADEIKVDDAWDVRKISAPMEVSPRVADSAKHVLGDTLSAKALWELLEKRFSAKQEGLQSALISKL